MILRWGLVALPAEHAFDGSYDRADQNVGEKAIVDPVAGEADDQPDVVHSHD
ncbi:MAG: hypothetical protein ABSB35_41815 [Bryobacteraceae bacterium]